MVKIIVELVYQENLVEIVIELEEFFYEELLERSESWLEFEDFLELWFLRLQLKVEK